jgi:hypothetical protein
VEAVPWNALSDVLKAVEYLEGVLAIVDCGGGGGGSILQAVECLGVFRNL